MSENEQKPLDTDSSQDLPQDGAGASQDGAAASADAATSSPEERIALLEAEKAEMKDRMLRIAAEFENWKKRARKDQSDGEARAKEGVLRDFLEIVDNLERATASFGDGKESDAKSVRDGVDLVLRQARSKFERYQVRPVESVGQPFDPRVHEAISQAPSAEAKPGSILHELQKGYAIGEKLLRPAMVVVATAPVAKAADDQGEN